MVCFAVDMPYVRLNASLIQGDKIIIDTKEVALKDNFNATICSTGVLDGKSYD